MRTAFVVDSNERFDGGEYTESLESVALPNWMRPWFRKPLRFQFDVNAVASGIAVAELPHFEINFEGVPF